VSRANWAAAIEPRRHLLENGRTFADALFLTAQPDCSSQFQNPNLLGLKNLELAALDALWIVPINHYQPTQAANSVDHSGIRRHHQPTMPEAGALVLRLEVARPSPFLASGLVGEPGRGGDDLNTAHVAAYFA
jgi:hypothetical protein